MKAASVKPVRCAIYTRVSTDHGLDQEFNSLDAQYDAASAYIKSQAHAGWTLIRSRYERFAETGWWIADASTRCHGIPPLGVGFSFSWLRFRNKPIRNFFLEKFDTPNRAINSFETYLTG